MGSFKEAGQGNQAATGARQNIQVLGLDRLPMVDPVTADRVGEVSGRLAVRIPQGKVGPNEGLRFVVEEEDRKRGRDEGVRALK